VNAFATSGAEQCRGWSYYAEAGVSEAADVRGVERAGKQEDYGETGEAREEGTSRARATGASKHAAAQQRSPIPRGSRVDLLEETRATHEQ